MRAGFISAVVSLFLGCGGGCLADDHADAKVVTLVAVAHLLTVGRSAILGNGDPGTASHEGVVGPFGDVAEDVVEAPWVRLQGSHRSELGMAVGKRAGNGSAGPRPRTVCTISPIPVALSPCLVCRLAELCRAGRLKRPKGESSEKAVEGLARGQGAGHA